MANAPLRPALLGPPIIRALSAIDPSRVPTAAPELPSALSQWVDWNRAVSLAAALDGRPPADRATDVPWQVRADALRSDHATTRQQLQASAESAVEALGQAPLAPAELLRSVQTVQRAAQAASGRLRGIARETVAARDEDGARLAAIDAVMEQTLAPREARLLENAVSRALAQWTGGDAAAEGWPEGLPNPLQHTLLTLLQADLTLRFHPVEGLLDALRTH